MMGSAFVTYTWAANRLNKSRRMLHNYINDGLLTRYIDAGVPFLRKDEVEALKVELDSNRRTVTRKNVIMLEQRVKRLEEEIVALKHILEVRSEPLRPSVQMAQALLAAAADALGNQKWSFEEIQLWATQLGAMDELTFDVFAKASPGDPKPWADFYRLCLAMLEYVEKQDGLETQALWHKLDAARKRLRGNILAWVELGRGSVSETTFLLLDTPKERVLRRVGVK